VVQISSVVERLAQTNVPPSEDYTRFDENRFSPHANVPAKTLVS
jgi:hypothetical protein